MDLLRMDLQINLKKETEVYMVILRSGKWWRYYGGNIILFS